MTRNEIIRNAWGFAGFARGILARGERSASSVDHTVSTGNSSEKDREDRGE